MQYREYIRPNDDGIMASDDSSSIQNAIDEAVKCGVDKVVIPRFNARAKSFEWIIESTVLLPDNIYLILDNCYMKLADDVFCNMFSNKNCRTKIGKTQDGTNCNITIEGRGNATLDGGKYNGISELNYDKVNGPHITNNCTVFMTNVDGFSVSGIRLINQRYWAMTFLFCSNGRIKDIDFMADHSCVDSDGNAHNYLSRKFPYRGMKVLNADGIDLRAGCHDIIVENITGFTQDDTIALTAIDGKSTILNEVEGLSKDIRNIIIRNVMSSSLYANVRLLNQGGLKIYNILIDGIMDTSADFPGLDRGSSGVRIGDHHMYGERHATSDETYNITIRNVYSRAIAPINIVCEMKNFNFDNIMSFDTK